MSPSQAAVRAEKALMRWHVKLREQLGRPSLKQFVIRERRVEIWRFPATNKKYNMRLYYIYSICISFVPIEPSRDGEIGTL